MGTNYLNEYIALAGLCRHGYAYKDSVSGKIYVSLPERIPHEERNDTRIYITTHGETLFDIAGSLYPKATDLRMRAVVVGQFQVDPILDIGLPLAGNLKLEIPSEAFFQETVYGPTLSEYPKLV
jgi:hypothetical protein